jgi:hypothetical protein
MNLYLTRVNLNNTLWCRTVVRCDHPDQIPELCRYYKDQPIAWEKPVLLGTSVEGQIAEVVCEETP